MTQSQESQFNKSHFNPLISVYIPTYNRHEMLARAIESVLNQSYRNFELIVIDDRSNDGTHAILDDFAAKDSRIRWFIKPKTLPKGACTSRNLAISKATGQFATGLDDDDYFCSHRLKDFVDTWHDGLIGLYSDTYNERKNSLKKIKYPKTTYAKKILAKNTVIQLFVELETLRKMEGYDEKFAIWQDFELWYRILKRTGGTAKSTGRASYVINLNDGHSRISHKSFYTIKKTYVQFYKKHKLNREEKTILLLHLFKYFPKNMPLLYWLSVFCANKSVYNLQEITKLTVKKFLR